MKHFLIVGNWKMNMGPAEATKLVEQLQKTVEPHTHVTSVLCPPFISLPAVSEAAESDIFKVGAQNLHAQDSGPFTGEVSGPMLKGLVQYVIVGHSERRREAHETDQLIAAKVAAALRNGLKPILCVGESLHDRENGHHHRVINDQLEGCLHQITAEDLSQIFIAYEPVWAISSGDGRGHFAKPEDVSEMLTVIRSTLEEMFGEGASSRVGLLYGGSVNADDCRAYMQLEYVDGLLVGGASLKPQEFSKIIVVAHTLAK